MRGDSVGGRFVCVHAADNSFPKWLEYNIMIGVGGWGGRNANSGPMLRCATARLRRIPRAVAGPTARISPSWSRMRDPEHVILNGLPSRWLHAGDELYATLCGPAENVTILATARSDVTHENEPMLMVITYGQGPGSTRIWPPSSWRLSPSE